MAFDPDAYLASKTQGDPVGLPAGVTPGFDPDAYLASKQQQTPSPAASAPADAAVAQQYDPSAGGSTLQVGPLDTGIPTSQGVDRFLAGAGKGMTDLARGAGQLVGVTPQSDIKEAERLDAPLMETGAGKAGAITGTVAAAAPTMFVPGANTYTGAALVGAGTGLLQPVAEGDVATGKAKNAAIGAAAGAAGQAVGNAIGAGVRRLSVNAATRQAARQAANAERDTTLAAARAEGYAVSPGMVAESGTAGKLLNGLSGKAKTEQLLRIRNQRVTDGLARRALGLPADANLTPEVTRAVRSAAYDAGYLPVARIGQMQTDSTFTNALNRISRQHAGASQSFPQAVNNDAAALVDTLRVPGFDTADALQMTQTLRDQAGDAFRVGNSALGRAQREAATAIEDQIERNLTRIGRNGAGMLRDFRDARVAMARAHTVEEALKVGTGSIDATKLAARLQKGKPLTGELETIARFANDNKFRDVAKMPGGVDANPLSVLDYFTMGGGAGVSAMSSGGAAGLPLMLMPAARVGARHAIASEAGQRLMTQPNYGPNLLQRAAPALQSDAMNALLRLSPSVYATQQQ